MLFPPTHTAHPVNLKKGGKWTEASESEDNKREWYTETERQRLIDSRKQQP